MSYGVHIISPCQLCDQWDWSVGSRTIFISPPFSLSSPRLSLSFKLLFSPSLSLYLSPSLARSLCLSSLFFFFFFFWPGRPSQCEIMVNAPWQSDTTHSPGPAPSGFNLIWSEKNGRGGGWWWWWWWRDVGWGERWRDGGLGACGVEGWWGWGGQDESLPCYSPPKSSHHPSFFPNCPLPSSHSALAPPKKSLKW